MELFGNSNVPKFFQPSGPRGKIKVPKLCNPNPWSRILVFQSIRGT